MSNYAVLINRPFVGQKTKSDNHEIVITEVEFLRSEVSPQIGLGTVNIYRCTVRYIDSSNNVSFGTMEVAVPQVNDER